MKENRLARASAGGVQSGLTAKRIVDAALRRIPFLGQSDALFLARNGFEVRFAEEDIGALRLPRSNYTRGANLHDQREVLFRALMVAALKIGVIDRKRNIIDVGAQNGDTALCWAKLIDGKVYAFDPSKDNIDYLNTVAGLNGISNVVSDVLAVGEQEGVLYPVHDVSHTPFTDAPLSRYGAANPVRATSFDQLHRAGLIENIGFLHLDVEGMELQALRGAEKMIAGDRPVVVFECHVTIDDIEAMTELLRRHEYEVYMINEATPGGRPDCVNFAAFPEPLEAGTLKQLNAVQPDGEFFKATLGPNLLGRDLLRNPELGEQRIEICN